MNARIYRLFIAEKPSMGRAIADCLPGEKVNERTHIRVGNDVVTWCVGHLLEMVMPEHYNPEWKSWRLDLLPMFPERIVMKPSENTKAQLAAIKGLLPKADEIVHAGDPGREGQMIVDEVLEFLNNRAPVKRLLLNATDPATIKKQLLKLEDNRKFNLVYEEAKCRSQADWLVGMNLTRAATKSIAGPDTMLSIGRVQSAALALVVTRCLAIESFVPRTFYDIEAKVETKGGSVLVMKFSPGTEEARIWDKANAQTIISNLNGSVGVMKVETQRKKVAPPKLYTLGSLQNDAGKKFKWSVTHTQSLAQKLYDIGCLTYPRTECHFLPEEQIGEVPSIMAALNSCSDIGLQSMSKQISTPLIRKNVFSTKGMEGEEHHAIIPTLLALPQGIVGDELSLYRMVCARFLMSLSPDYEHDETIAEIVLNNLPLKAKGSIPKVIGWKAFSNDKNPSEKLLPSLTNGEKARVINSRISEGKTTPPSYFMEGSFVDEEMGGIAKYVSDPKIKAILKEKSGIGTAATRANIVETLKKRGYVVISKEGFMMDTPIGRKLVQALPAKLTSPDMTAKWEIDLQQISKGAITPVEFIDGIRNFVKGGVRWFVGQKGVILIESSSPAKPVNTKDPAKKARAPRKPRAAKN